MFFKINFLKNFANSTRKHLCWSLSFNKVARLRAATLLKIESDTSVSLWILHLFVEYLHWRLSSKETLISMWNLPKYIAMFICRYFDNSKAFTYKNCSNVIHGVSVSKLPAWLQMYCSSSCSGIWFTNVNNWENYYTKDFPECVPVVLNCM